MDGLHKIISQALEELGKNVRCAAERVPNLNPVIIHKKDMAAQLQEFSSDLGLSADLHHCLDKKVKNLLTAYMAHKRHMQSMIPDGI
ncbi:hypothetical protein F3129_14105 [Bacillus velezensis]|uniref:hypothetical protein n=1 Tax=Bacillus velezensis TaxID=492670 RepID=UPI001246A32E|nr:hypothetical protein [Bacillus velezensis]QEV92515.1 hypothetical protein F3129_14105 [Bacillus velezensis]